MGIRKHGNQTIVTGCMRGPFGRQRSVTLYSYPPKIDRDGLHLHSYMFIMGRASHTYITIGWRELGTFLWQSMRGLVKRYKEDDLLHDTR